MHRFDSELDLETHELGRSLLFMIRDDDMGLHTLPPPASYIAPVNPFDAVCERLAAVELAIRVLRPQVAAVASIYFTIAINPYDSSNNYMYFHKYVD